MPIDFLYEQFTNIETLPAAINVCISLAEFHSGLVIFENLHRKILEQFSDESDFVVKKAVTELIAKLIESTIENRGDIEKYGQEMLTRELYESNCFQVLEEYIELLSSEEEEETREYVSFLFETFGFE